MYNAFQGPTFPDTHIVLNSFVKLCKSLFTLSTGTKLKFLHTCEGSAGLDKEKAFKKN